MFAFALWDGRTRELWLVRDRIGDQAALLQRPPRPARLRARRSRRCSRIRSRSAPSTRRRSTTTSRSSPRRRRGRSSAGSASSPAGTLAARRRRRADARSAATGTRGTTSSRSTACPTREIAERVLDELRTSVQLRKVSDVPVGVFLSGGVDSSTNAALFSEGERDAGQDVLDRLRRRLSDRTRTSSSTRGGWRARSAPTTTSGSCSLDDLLDFLPRDGAAPGRADRRPGLRARLLRLEARARQRRRSSRRSARAPTSSSSATRRGRRCCGSSSSTTCRCRGRSSAPASRALRLGGQGRPARAVRVPAPRRARAAGLLGRRRGVHRGAEAAAALAATARASSPGSPRGTRSRRSATASRRSAPGAVAPQLDDATSTCNLRLPELLLMRVDKMTHGRRPRRPRPVPRPPVRRARALDPDERRRRTAAS